MTWLKILFSIYAICCAVLYFFQERVIFKPHLLNEDVNYGIGKEIELEVDDGISLNCLLIKDEGPEKKGVILYLHGNKGNVGRGIYQSRIMRHRGADNMIVDYRGYGKSDGLPLNEKQMLSDIHKVYEYLLNNYSEDKIYIVAYSLGSSMASYLADVFNPKHVILVAPFSSILAIKNKYLWMFPDFLVKYKFDNAERLRRSDSKITIVHGTDDSIISYDHALRLVKANPDIELKTSKGQTHRGIIFDDLLEEALNEMI